MKKKNNDWIYYMVAILMYVSIIAITLFVGYKVYGWVMGSNIPDWLKWVMLR